MVLKNGEQKLVMVNEKESTYDDNVERVLRFLCRVLTFHIWG